MKKFILAEDFEDEVASEPVVEVEPGVVVPEVPPVEVVPEDVKKAALVTMLNDTINKEWEALNNINSNIATIKFESPEREDVLSILDSLVTEKTIHIGMLTKALSLIDNENQQLMDIGEEKAEEIISEPANDLNKGNQDGKNI